MTTELIITIAAVAGVILLVIAGNIRIVPQSKAWVMERIGVYSKTWHTGLHIKFPIIERAAKKVDLREQILVCGEGFNHDHYHNHNNAYNYRNATAAGALSGAGAVSDIAAIKEKRDMDMRAGASDRARINTLKNAEKLGFVDSAKLELENSQLRAGQYEVEGGFSTCNGTIVHNKRTHSRNSQPVITKDNVSMEMDTVVFYQVTDPKLYAYGHSNPLKAIEHLVATSLRNIVGGLELDETLTSRELINSKMRTVLDEATDPWGIKVTRVELRNIIISDVELAEAMEKQMIAEREKRAAILRAEGISQAEILEAQGKAEAIRLVNESKPSQEFLTIRALEAYEEAAKGQATKIIVPSNLQSLAGLALSGAEVFKEGEKMGE